MTYRRYYEDAYTHTFSARITAIEPFDNGKKTAVILDHTFFYPTGGGQPHDVGQIEDSAVLEVASTDDDEAILHIIETAPANWQPNMLVRCRVDWLRRFDHMQQHTGQHILSQAFIQAAGANTIGFHLSDDTVTIDLDRPALDPDSLAAAEALANQIVQENRAVIAKIARPEDIGLIRSRRPPDSIPKGGLRLIEIVGFDTTACGGTHVKHTGEIGLIKIVRVEKRGEKTRIEFCCGQRALRDYQLKHQIAARLSAMLTCGITELPAAVERMQQSQREALRAAKTAASRVLDLEVEAYVNKLQTQRMPRVIKEVFTDRSPDEVRQLALRLVELGGTIALFAVLGERTSFIFTRSADLAHVDMNALLKAQLASLHEGRGGGSAALAQGVALADAEQISAALSAAEAEARALAAES
ncbi:MAG: alanine--tRNA ligase-related protein [Aggregatilineales bacterium]